jgi:hypothetical protein
MKRFATGVVVGFLLSWGFTFAAPNLDHNGTFWTRLDTSAKGGYVNGYADAMQVSIGKLDNLSLAADLFRWKGAKKIIHQLSHELNVSDLKSDELVGRLNQLYSNRKYNELDLGSALQLLTLRSGEKIEAESPAAKVPPK